MANRQQFVVRLERELYELLKGESVGSGRSMQVIVDRALREFLGSENSRGSVEVQPEKKGGPKPQKISDPPWRDASFEVQDVPADNPHSKLNQLKRASRKGVKS